MPKLPKAAIFVVLAFLIALGLAVSLQSVFGLNIAGPLTGPLNLGTYKITNVGTPTADGDAATRKFVVDSIAAAAGPHGKQMFTTGSTFFTVPAGVTEVFVTSVGGGGGGGTLDDDGCALPGNGSNGGTSSFGGYVSASGGGGGKGRKVSPATAGAGGAAGGVGGVAGNKGADGDCIVETGEGDGGNTIMSFGGGKGGADTFFPDYDGNPGESGQRNGAGGGGGSSYGPAACHPGGGGGGGGDVIVYFHISGLIPGASIPVTAGNGGTGGKCTVWTGQGGNGAPGFVLVEW